MTDVSEAGMYTKWLKGASALLTLPTVIVDVQSAADDEHYYLAELTESEWRTTQEPNYEFLIEFTCKNESPLVEVTELRFSAREPTISDEQFAKMKQTAIDAGIDEDLVNSVALVDHSRCRDEDEEKNLRDWAGDKASNIKRWAKQFIN